MLPDTSDTEKMALIGRQTVLRKAKREALQELRDTVVPMLNTGEDSSNIRALLLPIIDRVEACNRALADLS
ncbi:hypothetical protein HNP33_004192 [Comamonas odontotermitis]|uniref:Uncharacterized protein n=1 Tax=Comamonas odontotermitis TaxID=379895 RepID=A0ABR6RLP0_9BURK|nr:hypothetical protein [Comamonas odontotermitis]MBB6580066.1 hypothetical protein [Comamonas odontotermitis]UBB15472.1 hypothetical protein LAD35_11355 [Comamonas odontotermitis]